MKRIYLMAIAVLMIFCFVGTADAQRKKKGAQGKRIVTMDIVITEVGEATIGYGVERRGRMRTTYIGVADVTRVQKADFKDVALKDVKKGDKALVTLYKDPDDPYFPALSIKVYGKAAPTKKARRAKKKRR